MRIGSVNLDGFELHGRTRYGLSVVSKISGWFERPGVQRQATARPNNHGSYGVPSYLAARSITLTGTMFPNSAADLEGWQEHVNGLIPGLYERRIQIEGHAGARWANVGWEAAPTFDEYGEIGKRLATFQIRLSADDPRKYGEERLFPVLSSIKTFHHGNHPADGKLIVTGAWSAGYRLNSGSGQVSVIAPVVPGKTHVLDFRRRTLRVDGLLVPRAITTGNFWETEPGLAGSRNVLITPLGTKSSDATANLFLTDTYI